MNQSLENEPLLIPPQWEDQPPTAQEWEVIYAAAEAAARRGEALGDPADLLQKLRQRNQTSMPDWTPLVDDKLLADELDRFQNELTPEQQEKEMEAAIDQLIMELNSSLSQKPQKKGTPTPDE